MDYDAMERLVKLRDQGVLTDDEFSEQKHIILNANVSIDQHLDIDVAPVDKYAPIQKFSLLCLLIGLTVVAYASFIYDNTTSPTDLDYNYLAVDENDSEEVANAIGDIANRLERSIAGERIINLQRVETQRQIFSFGVLLMLLGTIGFVMPLTRGRN